MTHYSLFRRMANGAEEYSYAFMKLKEFAKNLLPPILLRVCRRGRQPGISLSGPYASWQEALSSSSGYDSDVIVNKVKDALLKVKLGDAACERDSVTFETKQYSFPVLAGLLRARLDNSGRLNVLDFGGSLGSSYFLYRDFLRSDTAVHWYVVEQPKFVECAKRYFQNEELRFFTRLEDSMREAHPDIALFSSVLQYLEHPHQVLDAVVRHAPHYIVIDRTPFFNETTDLLMVQVVPPEIYAASYPSWIFGTSLVEELVADGYRVLADWDSNEGSITKGGIVAQYRGLLFERRDHRS
jgi:putative methyltransferase (TIGR04325 family)